MSDFKNRQTPGVYVTEEAPVSNAADENVPAKSLEIWPLTNFTFKITWDGTELIFQEATGLGSEKKNDQESGSVIMNKGFFKGDVRLLKKMKNIKTPTVLISLLDESQNATMSWTLTNASTTKITESDLQSEGNEIAVESIEIAYESMVISH